MSAAAYCSKGCDVTDTQLEQAFSVPTNFKIREVSSLTALRQALTTLPPLGPLAAFTGNFRGNGFNTIFRPQNPATPTPLPIPQSGSDNILELNLTQETLSFSSSLGAVPNRGSVQGDIFLNGVPYLQSVTDVTVPSQPTPIHLEPGLWLCVPPTTNPSLGQTITRMASIPHGTTIEAQGTASLAAGPPIIPPVDITPFFIGNPANQVPFPSQNAATGGTARIPQDLTPFITAGTITQAMLTDPNTLLRNHIATQNILSTTTISISTSPSLPLFGGGTDNIAFLEGNPAASAPNANAILMTATFWIETVQHIIPIPVFRPGQPALTIQAQTGEAGQPVAHFLVNPPHEIVTPHTITFNTTQIQYSQTVFLNFGPLTWPHVSVATLVPAGPIPVPPSAWTP
jgi:hypothetical protein